MPKRRAGYAFARKRKMYITRSNTKRARSFRAARKKFQKKYKAARTRRLMRRIGAEVKHGPMYTNANINDSENPTDSRMFMVYNTSTGGAYPTTWSLKDHLGTITQGDNQMNREGNKITIKSWKLNVTVSSVKSYPLMVRMIIGRPKAISNASNSVTNSSWTQLLQQGNITTAPLSTYLTYQQPINTDYWTVKVDKRFIINGLGDSTDASGEPDRQLSTVKQQYPDFRKFTFDLTKWFPKTITYDDDTSDPRMGKPLFLFFQTCTFGSQADHAITGNPYAVYCDFTQHLDFYDV